uniref:Uncharacterized protein AlNc14C5G673 n=1 Tax=Albugo laibachii Nc14 TaxID=890382 RepID=F0W0N4_9STRA|nr:conserved hypothetical protein [Albugo laibachii Nc14]|eukprot:CCA14606.1 conserved hypothetical protein [Albugo laibachii Nc14]
MSHESLVFGLIGTGKIGSAVINGFCSDNGWKPQHVYISKRSEEKSNVLRHAHPQRISVLDDNQAIIDNSDVVFIGLLPDVAKELIPELQFPPNKIIISMMATIPYEQLLNWTQLPSSQVVRTVPLPSAAKRSGPVLAYPKHELVEKLLKEIGTPVMVQNESEISTLTGVTALISFFYANCANIQQWNVNNGVGEESARFFISSFFKSLAEAGFESKEYFTEMAEEGATPGGLNEQVHRGLLASGAYNLITDQMDEIFRRLTGTEPARIHDSQEPKRQMSSN